MQFLENIARTLGQSLHFASKLPFLFALFDGFSNFFDFLVQCLVPSRVLSHHRNLWRFFYGNLLMLAHENLFNNSLNNALFVTYFVVLQFLDKI